jgi:hypothetical protein
MTGWASVTEGSWALKLTGWRGSTRVPDHVADQIDEFDSVDRDHIIAAVNAYNDDERESGAESLREDIAISLRDVDKARARILDLVTNPTGKEWDDAEWDDEMTGALEEMKRETDLIESALSELNRLAAR